MEQTIDDAIDDVLNSKLDFISYLKILHGMGITGYEVNVGEHTISYRGNGGLTKKMPLVPLAIAQTFDENGILNALDDIRSQRIDYPGFLQRIAQAGVASYDVDLQERRTLYSGAGKSHTESFPEQVRF